MSIAFDDRLAAAAAFRRHRRTWGRTAAWTLTLLHCARDPDVRLAAALALVVDGIPPNGVLGKEQRERREKKQAAQGWWFQPLKGKDTRVRIVSSILNRLTGCD